MDKHLIIGTAGHIDHGKTSLVKMLTGTDCDTHKEEKQRGITINLGFASLELPGGDTAGIIDVPGHKDFISTMIGGASGIDMVLLVIAADSGIMPQTREHLQIITSLGIGKGVVALTRSDLVDEELLEMAEAEVAGFLEETPLEGSPVVRVSSVTGFGKDTLLAALAEVASSLQAKEPGLMFRMFIDRIFSVKGFGSVVTGTVINGRLNAGDEIYLLPGDGPKLKVRSLERHHRPAREVVAGDRAAINLTGLRREEFARGMILCSKPLEPGILIDATVKLFEGRTALPVWSNAVFIAGTYECQARIHLLNCDTLPGGEEAFAQIHLGKPAILCSKDRFILRNTAEDTTLGGGIIIDTNPLHHRKRTAALVEELERLSRGILGAHSLRELIHLELKKEFVPMTPEELAERLHVLPKDILKEKDAGNAGFLVYESPQTTLFVNAHCDSRQRSTLMKALKGHHEKNPMFAGGMQTTELTGKTGLAKHPQGKAYVGCLLAALESKGKTDKHGDTWILHGHIPQVDPKTMAEIDWLEQEILNYGDNKPSLPELEERASLKRITRGQVKTYLTWLSEKGKISYCQSDFIHTTLLSKYRSHLLEKLSVSEQGIDIQEFKELIPGSKKFRAMLVDFLEAEQSIRLVSGEGIETRLFINKK
ncbi:MAG: selenocysteine-specific translation elongation factor [Bacteroidales bacterium]